MSQHEEPNSDTTKKKRGYYYKKALFLRADAFDLYDKLKRMYMKSAGLNTIRDTEFILRLLSVCEKFLFTEDTKAPTGYFDTFNEKLDDITGLILQIQKDASKKVGGSTEALESLVKDLTAITKTVSKNVITIGNMMKKMNEKITEIDNALGSLTHQI